MSETKVFARRYIVFKVVCEIVRQRYCLQLPSIFFLHSEFPIAVRCLFGYALNCGARTKAGLAREGMELALLLTSIVSPYIQRLFVSPPLARVATIGCSFNNRVLSLLARGIRFHTHVF